MWSKRSGSLSVLPIEVAGAARFSGTLATLLERDLAARDVCTRRTRGGLAAVGVKPKKLGVLGCPCSFGAFPCVETLVLERTAKRPVGTDIRGAADEVVEIAPCSTLELVRSIALGRRRE